VFQRHTTPRPITQEHGYGTEPDAEGIGDYRLHFRGKDIEGHCAQSEYQHSHGKETPREPDEQDRRPFGTAASAIPGITGVMPKAESFPLVEAGLTNREIEVASLLAQGHSAKYAARALGISYHTVRKHRENILQKLNIHSTSALVRIWASRPLV
jgi:DNA-binding CsgD family transcriptional regulator